LARGAKIFKGFIGIELISIGKFCLKKYLPMGFKK
jgi:hypothetical protein